MKNLGLKFKESVFSVVPITVIVLILGLTVANFSTETIISFLIGAVFIIVGMTLFTLGADVAMVPMGTQIGSSMTKTKRIWIIALICFLIGLIVTIAEPDLMVLAEQLKSVINKNVLIISVGVGVGLFLVLAMLRIVFQWRLRTILIICYSIAFVLAIFVPKEFMPLAFDSGGVTTGPMTVPFILAIGIGIASIKGGGNADDSFGLVALCSVGPILAVMILGLFTPTDGIDPSAFETVLPSAEGGIFMQFLRFMPEYMLEVGVALLPIVVFFLIYNFVYLKLSKKYVTRILVGIVYVFIGLFVFLTGVNIGFAPAGKLLGQEIVNQNLKWLLVPIGMVMGFFIVAAEPAVHVLNEQVEEISGGTIKKKNMLMALMCGVAVAIGLAMIRVITGISIWWILLPGYVIAIVLSFFVPKVYTAIAFDSGGVASGPMTATFLLPFAMGAASASGANVLTDAFGLVAFVAMTPLIAIQLMGLYASYKAKRLAVMPIEADELRAEGIEGVEGVVAAAVAATGDVPVLSFEDDSDDVVDFDTPEEDAPEAQEKTEPRPQKFIQKAGSDIKKRVMRIKARRRRVIDRIKKGGKSVDKSVGMAYDSTKTEGTAPKNGGSPEGEQ